MSNPRKSTIYVAWKSISTTLKAFFQCIYSVLVLGLFVITAFAAYVATLDDIPVPGFLLREIRDDLKTKGVYLRVDGMRFKPNGRISIDQPKVFSAELGATIASANAAIVKINLTHLLVGKITIDQVKVSNGQLFLPAMLSPSGLPETAIDSIDLEAYLIKGAMDIRYANISVHNLDISLSGPLKDSYIRNTGKKPQTDQATITQGIINISNKIRELQSQLDKFDHPTCIVALGIDARRQQFAEVRVFVEQINPTKEISLSHLTAQSTVHEIDGADLNVQLGSAVLPQNATVSHIEAKTSWNAIPDPENWLPDEVSVSVNTADFQGAVLQSLVASIQPTSNKYSGQFHLSIGDSPLDLRVEHFPDSKETSFRLDANLSPALPKSLDDFSLAKAELLLSEQAELATDAAIHVEGSLDENFKPKSIKALASSGPANIRGANIEQSRAVVSFDGSQIDVEDIWIRDGLQSGHIAIGYNLQTLFRRVMVEGSFDPTTINGWFKPWWAGMWEGMEFPETGMYTLLDSQATFKKPESVVVTGIGYGRGMNVRGIEAKEIRTRVHALFHYGDLYELELVTSDDKFVRGEIQFAMDRDKRDEKDKLTGMWIDAETNLDVRIAPEVIWEVADVAAEIVEPYSFEIPPYIKAVSSSVRHLDRNIYDVDLDIQTDQPFSYFGFPFERLETFVHVDNNLVDIPNARGGLGGGDLEVSAFIRGEDIELDVNLEGAGFGQTLVASNVYFAKSGSKNAQETDTQKLLNYGGKLNATFNGAGIVGNPLSFEGGGHFDISGADFGKYRLLGALSQILESTPLGFTTLAFNRTEGDFEVRQRYVHFPATSIDGPMTSLKVEGDFDIETDSLDFKAKLFPFRNSRIPLISPLINVALQPVSVVLEFLIKGSFNDPKLSIFEGAPRSNDDGEQHRNDHRTSRQ